MTCALTDMAHEFDHKFNGTGQTESTHVQYQMIIRILPVLPVLNDQVHRRRAPAISAFSEA
jgi:hypothetical protein